VIVASHDPTLAEHADRALHIVDGRIVSAAEAGADPAAARDAA
jgi:ABC-type lipoprotein export system ATPase subunit